MIWFKNSSGKHDAMLTFSIVGFLFVLIKVLIAGLTVHLTDSKSFDLGQIDGPTIAAILTPTLGAYVARRYTDRKYGGDPVPGTEDVKPEDK